eukprot:5485597-Pleurochrysis_carterae.AAC.2
MQSQTGTSRQLVSAQVHARDDVSTHSREWQPVPIEAHARPHRGAALRVEQQAALRRRHQPRRSRSRSAARGAARLCRCARARTQARTGVHLRRCGKTIRKTRVGKLVSDEKRCRKFMKSEKMESRG